MGVNRQDQNDYLTSSYERWLSSLLIERVCRKCLEVGCGFKVNHVHVISQGAMLPIVQSQRSS